MNILPYVYKINCTQCEQCYVGQTGRCLSKRISEHKSNLTKIGYSAISEHFIKTNHIIDFSHPKLLFINDKDVDRKIVEALCIKSFHTFDNNTQSIQLLLN